MFSHLISHGKPIRQWGRAPATAAHPLPAGSPAHKRTLFPLNDKQFCDAEAVKCIRQVQGSLPNWCVHVSVIWGQVNSQEEYTWNADYCLRGSKWAGGGRGCSMLGPLHPQLLFPGPPTTHAWAPSPSGQIASTNKDGFPELQHYHGLSEEQ